MPLKSLNCLKFNRITIEGGRFAPYAQKVTPTRWSVFETVVLPSWCTWAGLGGLPGEYGCCPLLREQDVNIFVGNLAFTVTSEQLREVFANHGAVISASVILDRDTGRSKGFGFVEMQDEDAGQSAIAALNDQPINGRPVRVNEARPRAPRMRRRGPY